MKQKYRKLYLKKNNGQITTLMHCLIITAVIFHHSFLISPFDECLMNNNLNTRPE